MLSQKLKAAQGLIGKNASKLQLRRFDVTTVSCVVVSALLDEKRICEPGAHLPC